MPGDAARARLRDRRMGHRGRGPRRAMGQAPRAGSAPRAGGAFRGGERSAGSWRRRRDGFGRRCGVAGLFLVQPEHHAARASHRHVRDRGGRLCTAGAARCAREIGRPAQSAASCAQGARSVLASYDVVAAAPRSAAALQRCLTSPTTSLIDILVCGEHRDDSVSSTSKLGGVAAVNRARAHRRCSHRRIRSAGCRARRCARPSVTA